MQLSNKGQEEGLFIHLFPRTNVFFFFGGGGGGEFALLFLKAARLLYAVFLLLCRK